MNIIKNELGDIVVENEVLSIESDNGFYIGDPCFVLSDEIYSDLWGHDNDFKDGIIETKNGNFIVQSTIYGDGEYISSVGKLLVESGAIAIIPMNLLDQKKLLELTADDISDYAAIIPGKEAQLTWETLNSYEQNPYFNLKGDYIINIKNPDSLIKIGIGYDDEINKDKER